ncbi:MAG: hypothetical protein ABI635_05865 [Actinomycetota bacterium]
MDTPRARWPLVVSLAVSASVFVAATLIETARFIALIHHPLYGDRAAHYALAVTGAVIGWSGTALVGTLLAGRGAGWLSFVPAAAALVLSRTAAVDAYQAFSGLMGDRPLAGGIIGLAAAALPVTVMTLRNPRRPLAVTGTALTVALVVAGGVLLLLDRGLRIENASTGRSALSWAFAASAVAIAVGWDARSLRSSAAVAAMLVAAHGFALYIATYALLLTEPMPDLGGWRSIALEHGAFQVAIVAVAIMPLARRVERLVAARTPAPIAS